jgi:hypothetical protein
MIFGWGFSLGVAQGYVDYGRWPIVGLGAVTCLGRSPVYAFLLGVGNALVQVCFRREAWVGVPFGGLWRQIRVSCPV